MTNRADNQLSKQEVLTYIVGLIKENKWELGEKIYSENQLAIKLGVSRHVVRSAYSVLEGIGIIETIPGDGTYLKKFENIDDDSPISLLMLLLNEDIDKLMEFRKIIEVGMISVSTRNIDKKHLKELQKTVKLIEKSQDYKLISKYDIKLHTIICESINNPFLSLVYNMILGYLSYISDNNWKEVTKEGNEEIKRELIDLHKQLVQYIALGDSCKAEEAASNHLNYIEENLNKFI